MQVKPSSSLRELQEALPSEIGRISMERMRHLIAGRRALSPGERDVVDGDELTAVVVEPDDVGVVDHDELTTLVVESDERHLAAEGNEHRLTGHAWRAREHDREQEALMQIEPNRWDQGHRVGSRIEGC